MKKTAPEKQQDKGQKPLFRESMAMMILGIYIPKKDETVYFNVDLTEPDEVYELTGYQESKIKVRPISRVQFLRGISVVN